MKEDLKFYILGVIITVTYLCAPGLFLVVYSAKYAANDNITGVTAGALLLLVGLVIVVTMIISYISENRNK